MLIKRCHFAHRWRAGFTFTEILIASLIIGMSFFALYSGMTYCLGSLRFARENLLATQIMVEKMEAIRLYNWERLNDPSYLPSTFTATYPDEGTASSKKQPIASPVFTGTLSITDAPCSDNYPPNIRLVTVNLTWKTGGTMRTRSMQSLVTRDGLHNYVY